MKCEAPLYPQQQSRELTLAMAAAGGLQRASTAPRVAPPTPGLVTLQAKTPAALLTHPVLTHSSRHSHGRSGAAAAATWAATRRPS
jgi:hypothetical protein